MGTGIKAHAPSDLPGSDPLFDAQATIFLFQKIILKPILPETDYMTSHSK